MSRADSASTNTTRAGGASSTSSASGRSTGASATRKRFSKEARLGRIYLSPAASQAKSATPRASVMEV